MNKTVIFAGSIAIAMTACGPPPESPDEGGTPAETESVTVTLPAGDVEAGRQAFLDLKCTACHRVPSEPEFPPPVSTNLGPTIDSRLVGRNLSDLATAIISPSHEISPKASAEVHASLEGVLSPMGDYSGVMTVRQLVDLNAYLYMRSMR